MYTMLHLEGCDTLDAAIVVQKRDKNYLSRNPGGQRSVFDIVLNIG